MNNKDISRAMSKALRHNPGFLNLTLDEQGWTDLPNLVLQLSRKFQLRQAISFDTIKQIVAECEKQRFAISEDGMRIRANQGHSIGVNLGLEARVPPMTLFHGTAQTTMPIIMNGGLKKMRRDHVHLSVDEETAIKVGRRHGKPFIFKVMAQLHHEQTGEKYYLSKNGVWLVDNVPVKYLLGQFNQDFSHFEENS